MNEAKRTHTRFVRWLALNVILHFSNERRLRWPARPHL